MIARLLMLTPAGRLVRWLAGDPPPRTLEQRIADGAEELLRRGWSPMAALAGAEAVEVGREHGLYFDRVEMDDGELRWYGVYTATAEDGREIKVPLEQSSEALQRGTAVLN